MADGQLIEEPAPIETAPAPGSLERFIPFRRADLIEMCLQDAWFTDGQRRRFRSVAALLTGLIHHEFHQQLEELKDAYAPLNPDLDTRTVELSVQVETGETRTKLVEGLRRVIEQANFEQLGEKELADAMASESLFQVRLHVDFRDFEDMLFFKRGETVRTETVRKWFGLRKREVTFTNYDRVVVFFRFKGEAHFEGRRRRGLPFEPGSVVIKLFQNIPKDDIEMLFPNAEVRMKPIDKVIIGVPAVVGGLIVLVTKLGSTMVLIGSLFAFWLGFRAADVKIDQTTLIALVLGLGALAAFLWKQFGNFRNRKVLFMKALSETLYFKNLDNNAGVFHRLIDTAEEEESKEVLAGYFMLLRTGVPMTAAELDREVEFWFRDQWDCVLDFEVNDALAKLVRFGLVTGTDGRYAAIPMVDAQARLDGIWDAIFEPDAEVAPA